MVTVHTGSRPRPLLEPSLKEPSSQLVVVAAAVEPVVNTAADMIADVVSGQRDRRRLHRAARMALSAWLADKTRQRARACRLAWRRWVWVSSMISHLVVLRRRQPTTNS